LVNLFLSSVSVTFVDKFFDFPDTESIHGGFRAKTQAITKDNDLNGSQRYALGTYYVKNYYKMINAGQWIQ